MKKIIAMLLSVLTLMSVTFVSAQEEEQINITYNGVYVPFDVAPQIINDRKMVPFRAIYDAIGGDVSFDEASGTVSSLRDGKTVTFKLGEASAQVKNGEDEETIYMDVAPQIVSDRTLVPVRFVAEASGLKVNWDSYNKEVVIIDMDAFKKELDLKAPFISKMFDMSLLNTAKYVGSSEFNLIYSYSVKNLNQAIENESLPKDLNIDFSIKQLGEDKSDGKSTYNKSAVNFDLSKVLDAVKGFSPNMTDEDKQMAESLLKDHDINIEVIVDPDFNIYLKSKEIMDLVSLFDGGQITSLIGDKYIKISLGQLLSENGLNKNDSIWNIIKGIINSFNNIYTEQVNLIDAIINLYADLYSNVVETQKEDGTTIYELNIDSETYKAAIKNYFEQLGGIVPEEETKAMYDALDASMKIVLEEKDGIFIRSEVQSTAKMTDLKIPESDITVSFFTEASAKSILDPTKDPGQITIPEDVFDILQ